MSISATDLWRTFPEMKGFWVRNLMYMRALADAWPGDEFVQQAAAQFAGVGVEVRGRHRTIQIDPTDRGTCKSFLQVRRNSEAVP